MKREKMKLTLVPSEQMDEWAAKNATEHNKIRLSRRARMYYGPSDWQNIYLKVVGDAAQKQLRIGQAAKDDIRKHGPSKSKRVGFVTTTTYNMLMGKLGTQKDRDIWISENVERVTIGADPEFVLVNDEGVAVYADTAFTDKWQKVGSDGPCAELRPDPSDRAEGLVESIGRLLNSVSTHHIQQYQWIGGATYRHPMMPRRYPIGGHIHFGLPNIQGAGKNTNPMLQRRVVRLLDELVALPLVRVDTPLPEERRVSLGYGKFQDCRTSNYKFEWRVPSGLWLVHPEIAFAVLGAAKAVVEESWKRYADRDCDPSFLMDTTEGGNNILTSFTCLDSEKVRSMINGARKSSVDNDLLRNIHTRLKSMSTYCTYREHIDRFIKLCSSAEMPLPTSKLELKRGWLEKKPL